jgi:predicted amidohydrolase YtcJ
VKKQQFFHAHRIVNHFSLMSPKHITRLISLVLLVSVTPALAHSTVRVDISSLSKNRKI